MVERDGFDSTDDLEAFVKHRDVASVVWQKSIYIINGGVSQDTQEVRDEVC